MTAETAWKWQRLVFQVDGPRKGLGGQEGQGAGNHLVLELSQEEDLFRWWAALAETRPWEES